MYLRHKQMHFLQRQFLYNSHYVGIPENTVKICQFVELNPEILVLKYLVG